MGPRFSAMADFQGSPLLACISCCLVCCLVGAMLTWFVWGIIITIEADGLRNLDLCDAHKFWWSQVIVFIVSGTAGFVIMAVEACFVCIAFSTNSKKPVYLARIVNMLLVLGWLGFASYKAFNMWHSLSDTPSDLMSMSNTTSYNDCEDWFENSSDENDNFLTLWKITAGVYFADVAIVALLICLTCFCIFVRGKAISGEDITVTYTSLK